MNNAANEGQKVGHADKTLRGLRHIGSAQLLTQLITWGFTAITIHLLRPSDYGLLATSGIVTALAQLLMDGGLTEVLISQPELSEAVQGAATSAVLLVSVVLTAIIVIISPAVSAFFRSPPLQKVLWVSAFYLPLSALEVVPKAVLSKRMLFNKIAVAQTVGSIVQGASTMGMAYSGAGYWALIFGTFIGSGLRISLLWLSLTRRPVPNCNFAAIRPLLRNSGHMMGMRLVWYLIDNFDLFILSRIGGVTALGAYSVARTLAYSAMNQIGSIVNQVALPAFAARTSRIAQVEGLALAISLASVLLFPMFWMMGAVSPTALPLVFGARWNTLVIPFIAFMIILPLRCVNTLLYAALLGTGRTGATLKVTLSWAAISVPLMFLGAMKGANGVALSWTVGFPLVFYLVVRQISHELAVRVTAFLRPMLAPAVCGAASAVVSGAVLFFLRSYVIGNAAGRSSEVILVASQCVVGGGCYWLLLRYFGTEQLVAIFSVFRRLVRP